ncbi:ribbon-helix-helix protein, CopG family [Aeoliella sp.]|uniref:ribbon-helix-helix protein, CopG family n=1 Tax=Aeoliella sp. TaxID=2795800 RepID=UPI003CCBD04B
MDAWHIDWDCFVIGCNIRCCGFDSGSGGMMKSERITITVDPQTYKRIVETAKAANMSLSHFVRESVKAGMEPLLNNTIAQLEQYATKR